MSDLDERTLEELKEAFDVSDVEPDKQLEFAVEVNHRISTLSDQHYFLEQSMQDSDVQISTEEHRMLSTVNRFRELNFNNPEDLKRVGVLCWLNYLESLEERLHGGDTLMESRSVAIPDTSRPDVVTCLKHRVPYLFRPVLEKTATPDDGLLDILSQQQHAVALLSEMFNPERLVPALKPIRELIETLQHVSTGETSDISNSWLNVIRSVAISRYGQDETAENIGNNIAYMLEDLLGMPTKMTVDLDSIPTLENILFGDDFSFETTEHKYNTDNNCIHCTTVLFDNRYLSLSTPKLESLNPLEQFADGYSYWRTSIHIEALDDRDDGEVMPCDPDSEHETYAFNKQTLDNNDDTMRTLSTMVETANVRITHMRKVCRELIMLLIQRTTATLTNPEIKDKIGFVEFRAITFVVEYAINTILHPIYRTSEYLLEDVVGYNQKWLNTLFKTSNKN